METAIPPRSGGNRHGRPCASPWRALVVLGFALAAAAHASVPAPAPDPHLRAALKAAVAEARSFPDRFEAQVWLTDMAGRLARWVEDPAERLAILRTAHQEASRAGLDPELVLAVIHVESRFDRFAISRVGARGLMQVMPFWLEEIGRPEDNLFDIRTNLRLGCTILRYYLDLEDGRLTPALARYNGSYGRNTYPVKVFQALERHWFEQ